MAKTAEEAKKCQVFVDADAFTVARANHDLVGSIDQGTSSSRFLVFNKDGSIAASAQMEHTQIFPSGEDKVGWHEHDPLEIWNSVKTCVNEVAQALRIQVGVDINKKMKSVGITNQRETTVAWNASTGKPYFNAIVWDDTRTQSIAHEIAGTFGPDRLREKTGLPLASYFAGTKVRWLLDNVPDLSKDLKDPKERDNVRFGTIDTWLVYQITGEASKTPGAANVGGIFVTDVSNASRWLFMDIAKVEWDKDLLDTVCGPVHDVPIGALPQIKPSSGTYSNGNKGCGVASLSDVPVSAILGDQQSALFGQCAFEPGEAKCTYGTGLFLMMGTGTEAVPSTQGLLTTVAYQLAPKADGTPSEVNYALEGSVSHSGSTVQWLRDQLGVISTASESETLAKKTKSNDGLYFVPAFSGLFAPHWRDDARACIVGMSATHTKCHVARAALEAAAYQAREVFDAIVADSGVALKALRVDGGATANSLLMQFQSDVIGVPVVKPVVMETTARGAAFAAGLAVGVWSDLDELRALWKESQRFEPNMSKEIVAHYWNGWQRAVQKSMGWIESEKKSTTTTTTDEKGQSEQMFGENEIAEVLTGDEGGFGAMAMMGVIAVSLSAGYAFGRFMK